jgi:hypothetical protein
MKIALLLTGQLRTVDMVKYLHTNTIINKHDTDVFIAIDLNNTLQTEKLNSQKASPYEKAMDVVKYFNPKKYFISNNFDAEHNRLVRTNTRFLKLYKSIFAQYYIVHNAYKLLQDYIDETHTHYDLVMRLRFDQFLCERDCHSLFSMLEKNSKGDILYTHINTDIFRNNTSQYSLPLYKPVQKEIYVFGRGTYANCDWVNDQFFYHTPELVAALLTFYNSLPQLLDIAVNKQRNKGHCIFEHVFALFLKEKEFDIKFSDLASQFIREFA